MLEFARIKQTEEYIADEEWKDGERILQVTQPTVEEEEEPSPQPRSDGLDLF